MIKSKVKSPLGFAKSVLEIAHITANKGKISQTKDTLRILGFHNPVKIPKA